MCLSLGARRRLTPEDAGLSKKIPASAESDYGLGAASAQNELRRVFSAQPGTGNGRGEARMAGFAGEDQPAISKRFRQYPTCRLRARDGVAIAAEKLRVFAPISDDGWAQRLCCFSAKNMREFGASMRFCCLFAGA